MGQQLFVEFASKKQIATEENFNEDMVIKWKPGHFYDWVLNC